MDFLEVQAVIWSKRFLNFTFANQSLSFGHLHWSGGTGAEDLQLPGGVIGNFELQLPFHDRIGKGAVAPKKKSFNNYGRGLPKY